MKDRIDACLTAAFHDLPVPDGLADRLLGRLAIEGQPRVRRTRRWVLAAAGLATVAAGLLVAIALNTHRESPFSEQLAIEEALRAFSAGFEGTGYLLSERASPADYPFSPMVQCFSGTHWRHLDGFLGHRGVAYELPGPAGVRATLYVIAREDVEGVGLSPAVSPFTTAGCCASAWQDGGRLYVLVVQGDTSMYKQYLRLPRSPIA
jgi:hypothetical protein